MKGFLPQGGSHKDFISLFNTFNTAYSGTLTTSMAFGGINPRPRGEREEFVNERSEFTNSGEGVTTARSHKVAFTLAEVLITLGIIGVVAAMTMPTLMAQHRKQVVETRLAKFYSTINQAIQAAEVEHGDKAYWDVMKNYNDETEEESQLDSLTPEEWFDKYLAKYITVIKRGRVGTTGSKYVVYLPDGSAFAFSSSSWLFFPESKHYKELEYGENGAIYFDKKDSGKYWFTFYFAPNSNSVGYKNKGVEPFRANSFTEEQLRNNATNGCNINATGERAYCTELIRRNGWKIPKDYPFKF